MAQQLPKVIGIRRVRKGSALHREVVRNLDRIAKVEDKTFSYVVSEIVYAFFGLKVQDDIVKIRRVTRRPRPRLKLVHSKRIAS
jgi:hypothetical protein